MNRIAALCGLCVSLLAGVGGASNERNVIGPGPRAYVPLVNDARLRLYLRNQERSGWTEDAILLFSVEKTHGGTFLVNGRQPARPAIGDGGTQFAASPAISVAPPDADAGCPTIKIGSPIPPRLDGTTPCPAGYQWMLGLIPEDNTQCVQIACNTAAGAAVKSYFDLVYHPADQTYSYQTYFNINGAKDVTAGILFQDILYAGNHGASCMNYFVKSLEDAQALEKVEPKLAIKTETYCGQAPDHTSGYQYQVCTDMPPGTPVVTCPKDPPPPAAPASLNINE